jgi:uncharacterized protein YjiS (DUF1127 family)
MTKFPLGIVMRFQEWFEVHLIRWRLAHLELEDDTDEQLKDIGLEPLERNFTALKPFWKL